MPTFQYRAVDGRGAVVKGTLTAVDQAAALAQLRSKGELPIRVAPQGAIMAALNTEITPRNAVCLQDLAIFARSLATLASAGLPLDRSLGTVSELGTTKAERGLAGRLLVEVRAGKALSDALDAEGDTIPPVFRSMLRAGEASARMETTLGDIADMLESQIRRRGALRSALIYPAFLLVTAIGAVALLLGYVVPTFKPLLEDAGAEPPAITKAVIAAGGIVEDWGLACLAGLLGLFIGFRFVLRDPKMQLRWHLVIVRLPVIGTLVTENLTAQAASLLADMLKAGVALPSALRLACESLPNAAFRQTLEQTVPRVERGEGLAAPLAGNSVMPPLAIQLIKVGEESGDLAPMLAKVAEIFQDRAQRSFDNVLALLTPLLTLVMGLLIAVIIGAILFALFSINELAI